MTNAELTDIARAALQDVPDPDTGISIVDMGLVYGVDADAETGAVKVTVTFTTPACPAGDAITAGIERRLARTEGIHSIDITLSFDPPWSPERISPEARATLGFEA